MRRTGIITTDSENQKRSSWILIKNLINFRKKCRNLMLRCSTISVIIKISPSFQKRMTEIFRPAYSCSNQSTIS
ncbi:hypothetical protein DWW21_18190 [Blautia obeum]|uniref:Uncharacterized protein n=1 Tax=Blautia obeum TaxID=40520 RepID=A0A395X3Z4_9FIRM|nr:hypothetical protein DWW21_18190 [Blautia obeum]RGV60038.1 hypothetical protein DWW07_18525 [Blautia obeum]